MLIYCSVGGLSLLDYQFTEKERQLYVSYVYDQLVTSGEGFRGSALHKLPNAHGYDPPTISNTYAALCILLMLGDDYLSKVDADLIMKYVSKCQLSDGSFKSLLDRDGKPSGDGDLRQSYMAASIRKLFKYRGPNDFDVDSMADYVRSLKVYDGGLGNSESHAGLTFCGLAALQLVDKLDSIEWVKTVEWLVHRQISFSDFNSDLLVHDFFDDLDQGSHNGRVNKTGDTCYSFWCTGSLALLGKESFVNADAMINYLLGQTQCPVTGGFGKTEVDDPDPYHSFLALCAISLVSDRLKNLNPSLVVTQEAYDTL